MGGYIKKHERLKELVQPGLDIAYKYYDRMDRTRAYVVTMCQQIHLLTRKNQTNVYLQSSTLLYGPRFLDRTAATLSVAESQFPT